MANHTITKSYGTLKGLSTDSDFIRPPQYCSRGTMNMMRDPDSNFTPRRGFQGAVRDRGGLGVATRQITPTILGQTQYQVLTIDGDGNLYELERNTLDISYAGPTWVELSIFVDQRFDPFSLGWSVAPWSIAPWGAVTHPGITSFVTVKRAAVANGAQAGVNIFNVDNPHVVTFPGVIQFLDQNSVIQQRNVTAIGAATVSFDGFPSSIKDNAGIDLFYDIQFGIGYDNPIFFTVQDYIDILNIIPGITAVDTGNTGNLTPAAFLSLTEPLNITNANNYTLAYYEWSEVNKTVPVTFQGLITAIGGGVANIENASFANFEETIYIGTGFDFIKKYDGQTVYNAGMPEGPYPYTTEVNAGVGAIPAGVYTYNVTYEQIDALGNIVEGEQSDTNVFTIATPPSSNVQIVVANLTAGSGWNTDAATVNGNQLNTAIINVNAGHTMKTGDTAFFVEAAAATSNGAQANVNFFNVNAGHTVQVGDTIFFFDNSVPVTRQFREITATTATTITFGEDSVASIPNARAIGVERTRHIVLATPTTLTIAAPGVNVVNGQVISNNLKINIYRTKIGGTQQFLVYSIPNNSFAFSTTVIDIINDPGLGRTYNVPVRTPNPPPFGARYLFAYRNQMIYTGIASQPDSVYFSEGASTGAAGNIGPVEYVSTATNFFDVPANDDNISGIGQSGSTLIVFKDQSIYGVTGDLLNSQFSVQPISPGTSIGCAANASIASINGMLYFLSSDGVYAIIENTLFPLDKSGNPIPISRDIDVIFRRKPPEYNYQFQFKKAVAINYPKDHQYILFMPCHDFVTPNFGPHFKNANLNSRTLVFDYQSKDWFEWDTINAAGGFYSQQDFIFWQERRFSVAIGNAVNLYRQLRNYRLIDQTDHAYPINVTWVSSWEDLGQPQVRKKFIRALLLIDRLSDFKQYNNPALNFSSYLDRVPNLKNTKVLTTTVNNSTSWSVANWGFSPWAGLQDNFVRVNLKQGTVAKAMQIGFQMREYNTSFRLQGFQLEVATDFRTMLAR